MTDGSNLLDLADRVVALAADTIGEVAIGTEAAAVGWARRRRGYLGRTVVVALAGGTGSGKSSLLNALAEEEIAPTGPRRPTTERPLAWIPVRPEAGLVRLLADLRVEETAGYAPDDLAVVDLPDIDSLVASQHAEELVSKLDVVMWLVDPEKYQDRRLHEDFLRVMAIHEERIVFILNQIDRLPLSDVALVIADLQQSLKADGFSEPQVLAIAADPEYGPAIGIDGVWEVLNVFVQSKSAGWGKLTSDLHMVADSIDRKVGAGEASGFGEGWPYASKEAARMATRSLLGEVGPRLRNDGRRRARSALRRPWSDAKPQPVTVGARVDLTTTKTILEDFVDSVGTRREQVGDLVLSGAVATGVDQAVYAAVMTTEPPRIASRPWWRVAGAVSWLAIAAVGLALLWFYDRYRNGQSLLPPGLVVFCSCLLFVGLRHLLNRSGTKAGEQAIQEWTDTLQGAVGVGLERSVGRPVREVLRPGAEVAAALVELRLALADETLHEISV